MINRKEVIRAFELEREYVKGVIGDEQNREIFVNTRRLLDAYEYAIDVLTEQQPVYSRQMKHFVCPSCSLVLDEGRDDYCPACGKKIAWDEMDD